MMEDLKTAREAASYLHVSYSWLVSQLQQGKIRAYKAGNGWRIEQRSLDDYLKKHDNRRVVIS